MRTQEAKRLLTETTDSITTIALEIGYNDSAQFSATFKKQAPNGLPQSMDWLQ
ncbi:AraC-like DNA-binding protein [Alkalihalobacillus xiaoxiensis]|uniref:AraC-like DNA-binding protein n=1 Tax=Shouchella xiaoxiensis TaxID=766895 RepID=A0ABS2SUB0_9BACI|nr:helix-turn-helix domain-containing protein [Shouchella xiaoxiensis]MBM7837822.1 AraC-like DNA-binding protein [Shouchella xiaoxiensis]